MENDEMELDALNPEQEVDLDTTNDSEDEIDYKTLYQKEKERAENQKIRAEKAEKLAKQKPSETSKQVTPELDNATLARIYGIEEEDFEEVLDMAKFKKLSIAETLKLGATKAILAEKAEFRKTAEVSNTGNARRGASKVSDDVLLKNLEEGKIPEAGSEEAERLFWARRGGKR